MGKKIIPLHFCKSKVPLIVFEIGDKKYYAILDTGSEITLISDKLKDIINIVDSDLQTSFTGVGGSTEYQNVKQGCSNIILKDKDDEVVTAVIGGAFYNLKSVSSHFKDKSGEFIDISAIIGGDFLKHYEAKINYKEKTLTLNIN